VRSGQFSLLLQVRFWPFFGAQFLGAFNDNLFKTALVTVITFDAASWTSMNVGLLNNLIAGLFILPFVLASATAGQLADKIDKSRLMRLVKVIEIVVMLVAAVGWYTHSLWILILAVVGMGLHSALFGPVKHSYLPQHLDVSELVGGNGMVQMGTFVGILTGQLIGASLVSWGAIGVHVIIWSTVVVAVVGLLFTLLVPHTPAPEPELIISRNPFPEIVSNLKFAASRRDVFIAMLANSWFWFFGAMLLAQFPVFARDVLHGEPEIFALLLTAFSLGIGVGSLMCERLSGRIVQLGLVPLGAIGLSAFSIDLYIASSMTMPATLSAADLMLGEHFRIFMDCLLIGLFGGLYVVPLFALIQTRGERTHLSRIIGGMNILNALFMVMAALTAMLLLSVGLSVVEIFAMTAIANAVLLILLCLNQPEYARAFLTWLIGLVKKRPLVE
jgi:MFS family permease